MDFDFSQYILVDEEKRAGLGEDNHVLVLNQDFGLICALDGSGGSGGRIYEELGGWTGAKIGSGAVSNVIYEWAMRQSVDSIHSESIAQEWKKLILKSFSMLKVYAPERSVLAGSILKEFPTTLAACIVRRESGKSCLLDLIWAGDSRVYLLDESGLHQLTADDIRNQDAFENLKNDAPMTNVVCAEGFELHHYTVRWKGVGIVFAASDGAFGYLPTPMHFEALLLETLEEAASLEEWESKLRYLFRKIAMDDVTFCGVLYGFQTFRETQKFYRKRNAFLQNKYISPLEEPDEDRAAKLWQQYKKDYESYPERFKKTLNKRDLNK